jgi:hypothetical protein
VSLSLLLLSSSSSLLTVLEMGCLLLQDLEGQGQ